MSQIDNIFLLSQLLEDLILTIMSYLTGTEMVMLMILPTENLIEDIILNTTNKKKAVQKNCDHSIALVNIGHCGSVNSTAQQLFQVTVTHCSLTLFLIQFLVFPAFPQQSICRRHLIQSRSCGFLH